MKHTVENPLFSMRDWKETHRLADEILAAKDGAPLVAIYLSPEGRSRDEHQQYVARLQAWAASLTIQSETTP